MEKVYLVESINKNSIFYGHWFIGYTELTRSGNLSWWEHINTECNVYVINSYIKNKKNWKVTEVGDF